ncbi:hypothetical protein [Campylobacter pinnipediorum]|uniref:hypothetical protein n=1 Tax=Campylobacter pinnipediorum TaxID=1965231 RepID=UPI00084D6912|nr:hypothetical protein [Campylobacter pinnipediorum]AQW82817.1 putative membrane protein [Campylobacter pinnipediorum subsp. pinnipediorum]AQW84504.1 putative membrane protein [Campylobacter pinnipediorum subsp. pinnipediorum]
MQNNKIKDFLKKLDNFNFLEIIPLDRKYCTPDDELENEKAKSRTYLGRNSVILTNVCFYFMAIILSIPMLRAISSFKGYLEYNQLFYELSSILFYFIVLAQFNKLRHRILGNKVSLFCYDYDNYKSLFNKKRLDILTHSFCLLFYRPLDKTPMHKNILALIVFFVPAIINIYKSIVY